MLSLFFFSNSSCHPQAVFLLYLLCTKAVVQLLLVRKSCEIFHDLLSLRNPSPGFLGCRAFFFFCYHALWAWMLALAGYEGLAGGLEPIRNREIF